MGRLLALVIVVAGCGFEGSGKAGPDDAQHDAAPPVTGDALDAAVLDAPRDGACWPFAVTNFDPCVLPALGDLTTTLATGSSFDTDTPPAGIAVGDVTQSDGTHLAIVHVASLAIGATTAIGVTGSRLLVIVSEGDVTITGSIQTNAGSGLGCTGIEGNVGIGSTAIAGGGGGAGGAGGATDGTDGGDGRGVNPGAHGAHGNHLGTAMPKLISPLHGGCSGAPGGGVNGNGGGGGGGGAGGGLQITTRSMITLGVGGKLLALGFGGGGGTTQLAGGGSGGSGGAILLEGTDLVVENSAVVCADGGAGGQGGGAIGTGGPGAGGGQGACTGIGGAVDGAVLGGGSLGGSGGWQQGPGPGGSTSDGGGGGGGSAGFLRFHVVHAPVVSNQAVVTPIALVD